MTTSRKRLTVYFDPDVYEALKARAKESERSISDYVNEAVQLSLAEDAHDMAIIEERANEPSRPFEQVMEDLRHHGKI